MNISIPFHISFSAKECPMIRSLTPSQISIICKCIVKIGIQSLFPLASYIPIVSEAALDLTADRYLEKSAELDRRLQREVNLQYSSWLSHFGDVLSDEVCGVILNDVTAILSEVSAELTPAFLLEHNRDYSHAVAVLLDDCRKTTPQYFTHEKHVRYLILNMVTAMIDILKTDPDFQWESILHLYRLVSQHLLEEPNSDPSHSGKEHMTRAQLRETLWQRSQDEYRRSHSLNNRFYGLNIIDRLLPSGYDAENSSLPVLGQMDNHDPCSAIDLYSSCQDDLSLLGEGGIGKTTFLQKILRSTLLDDQSSPIPWNGQPIPIFIELNRCPEDLSQWYDPISRQTNFILRFIAALAEGHSNLNLVSTNLLQLLEKDMSSTADTSPAYILLLDGFNEVNSNYSTREFLSSEILALHQYANVRVITTSRETQNANYQSQFRQLKLIGLTEDTIREHLQGHNIPQTVIADSLNHKVLRKCLRIPLYLCMFSVEMKGADFIPETPGEILYLFFHRESGMYNARSRVDQTEPNPLRRRQIKFVLDLILPYIGWSFEEIGSFHVKSQLMEEAIQEGFEYAHQLLSSSADNCFAVCNHDRQQAFDIYNSFFDKDGYLNTAEVLRILYDQLGIIYRDFTVSTNAPQGPLTENWRYAFIHHHFRDYFASMWNVLHLFMLSHIDASTFCNQHYPYWLFLNTTYWPSQKTEFISQILMEHRNRPVLNSHQRWTLPPKTLQEQCVLEGLLDFARTIPAAEDLRYLLANALAAIRVGRGEFTGLNLSGLNLRGCNFFNIINGRPNSEQITDFRNSILDEAAFQPQDHLDPVIEYINYLDHCYTLDFSGCVKEWDMDSGNLKRQLQAIQPVGNDDFSSSGWMKISDDEHWLMVKYQVSTPRGTETGIEIFDLSEEFTEPKILLTENPHRHVDFIAFSDDCNYAWAICDNNILYCWNLESWGTEYCRDYQGVFFEHTEIYGRSAYDQIYAFTTTYKKPLTAWREEFEDYDIEEDYPEDIDDYSDDEDDGSDGGDDYSDDGDDSAEGEDACSDDEDNYSEGDEDSLEDEDICACMILDLNKLTVENRPLCICQYTATQEERPVIGYCSESNAFLFHDFTHSCYQYLNAATGTCREVLHAFTEMTENLSPDAIHMGPAAYDSLYIIFNEICFCSGENWNPKKDYLNPLPSSKDIPLLAESEQDVDLYFCPNVRPSLDHYLLRDENNKTYDLDYGRSTIRMRFNTRMYNCCNLIRKDSADGFLLIHENNGITEFTGPTPEVSMQYCFADFDYDLQICCDNKAQNLLALCFVRADHEKVCLLHLDTGYLEDIYSTMQESETITSMEFHTSRPLLLIVTQYHVVEYDYQDQRLRLILTAAPTERTLRGRYMGNALQVVISDSRIDSGVPARCEEYLWSAASYSYQRSGYYEIPILTPTQSTYFITDDNDLGTEISQDMILNEGFFLRSRINPLDSMISVKWHSASPSEHKYEIRRPLPFESLYVCYTNRMRYTNSQNQIAIRSIYHGETSNEYIFIRDHQQFTYEKDVSHLTYEDVVEHLSACTGCLEDHSTWSFLIPYGDGHIIGCGEGYRLFILDQVTGKIIEEIEYQPGVSIKGCLM